MKKIINGIEVEFKKKIQEGKEDSLWYGGLVASFKYKDSLFELSAEGDVSGDIYKKGTFITHFKDKGNNGSFNEIIQEYTPIKNDVELSKWLTNDFVNEETLKNKQNLIYLDDNNWWCLSFIYNGILTDLELPDCYCPINKLLNEITKNIENYYNDGKDTIIM